MKNTSACHLLKILTRVTSVKLLRCTLRIAQFSLETSKMVILANSADLDQAPQNSVSDQGRHCFANSLAIFL